MSIRAPIFAAAPGASGGEFARAIPRVVRIQMSSRFASPRFATVPVISRSFAVRTASTIAGAACNVLLNFVVPFLGLLSVPAKTDPRRLAMIAGVILIGRWLDLYILIMPTIWREPQFGFVEPICAIGYGALLVLLFRFFAARAPLVPRNDPVLAADASAAHPVARRHAA